MGADNWRVCPQCKRENFIDILAKTEMLNKSYWNISSEDFIRISVNHANFMLKELPEELREDYEIGCTAEGMFYVDYGCSCQKCGFSYSYKKEIAVLDEKSGSVGN